VSAQPFRAAGILTPVDPKKCVFVDIPQSVNVNSSVMFNILAKDSNGEKCLGIAKNTFEVKATMLEACDGEGDVTVTVEDKGNGEFSVELLPIRVVNIFCNFHLSVHLFDL